MVLFIMVTFDHISGKSAWSNHGLLWVKDTTSLAFSLPRTEQLLHGVTLELDGYLAFVVSPFITKSSSRWFWMHLLMRWLHEICSNSLRPLCLEHEQTAEWYEMSSAQAGLRISNQLGNEGWGGARQQWAQCSCEIPDWILAICVNHGILLKDSLNSGFCGWKQNLQCRNVKVTLLPIL